MLHLYKHIYYAKIHVFRLNISFWRFYVRNWHLSIVACFKSEWRSLCCRWYFESTLKYSQWVKSQEKSLFLSSAVWNLLFAASSLWHRRGGALQSTSRWILNGYTSSPFLIICQHRPGSTGSFKDKFHYNINVLSLLINCTPPPPVMLINDGNLVLQLSQLQMKP